MEQKHLQPWHAAITPTLVQLFLPDQSVVQLRDVCYRDKSGYCIGDDTHYFYEGIPLFSPKGNFIIFQTQLHEGVFQRFYDVKNSTTYISLDIHLILLGDPKVGEVVWNDDETLLVVASIKSDVSGDLGNNGLFVSTDGSFEGLELVVRYDRGLPFDITNVEIQGREVFFDFVNIYTDEVIGKYVYMIDSRELKKR